MNRFGITLAADEYTPKDAQGKLPAMAVMEPFGAVKVQSSGICGYGGFALNAVQFDTRISANGNVGKGRPAADHS